MIKSKKISRYSFLNQRAWAVFGPPALESKWAKLAPFSLKILFRIEVTKGPEDLNMFVLDLQHVRTTIRRADWPVMLYEGQPISEENGGHLELSGSKG